MSVVATGAPLNQRVAGFLDVTPRDDPGHNVVMLKSVVLNIERARFEKRAYQDPRHLE